MEQCPELSERLSGYNPQVGLNKIFHLSLRLNTDYFFSLTRCHENHKYSFCEQAKWTGTFILSKAYDINILAPYRAWQGKWGCSTHQRRSSRWVRWTRRCLRTGTEHSPLSDSLMDSLSRSSQHLTKNIIRKPMADHRVNNIRNRRRHTEQHREVSAEALREAQTKEWLKIGLLTWHF